MREGQEFRVLLLLVGLERIEVELGLILVVVTPLRTPDIMFSGER